ncbi:MAG: hypothetical protein RL398_1752 [Planctomycetota bacterium]
MNILAGVDEAGLGPILGPLVVGGVAMQGPAGAAPWEALATLVARERHEKGKIRVADSKKVHSGPHGLRRLEETALTMWAAWRGDVPATLADWLQALGVDLEQLRRCPWYEGLDLPLPLVADRGYLTLHGELVARALQKAELAILDLAVRPVDVEEWNALIAVTDNKSKAHFHAYSEVIARILRALPERGEGDATHLVADRCGGRMHYGGDLRRLFPERRIEVVDEQPAVSTYRMHGDGGGIAITFSEKGEERAFPTALASCLAKYCRETMMEVLNRWFATRIPGLEPTAGYYVDGHRWLDAVMPHLPNLPIPTERLVRVR